MDQELDAWNSFTKDTGASGYALPVQSQIDNSAIVDSSGNTMSGLNLGSLLKVGGDIFSAYGDILAGDEANKAYQYNAQLALEQSQFDINNMDLEETHMLSTQRAMYAKAGVTMSGSPLDVAFNTASQFEMNKQIATYNAESKANMDKYQGQIAKSQGEIKAGETLLSGAFSFAMGG